MKAITTTQPWASLIVEGIKDIENRTWKCPEKYIGKRILIHAGMVRTNHIIRNVLNDAQYAEFRKKYKYSGLDFLEPMGAIIGSVEIVDCVINHPSIWAKKSIDCKDGCLDVENCPTGKCPHQIYNWVLANPINFPEPIQCKGKIDFWESECEILICPKCGGYCLHDNHDAGIPNWGNPVHECEYCNNMILESEFEYLK